MGNQLSKTTPFIGSTQAIIYQSSNHHNIQYNNYCCKKHLFYCCYLCLLNSTLSFCIKRPFSNLSYSTFKQRIVISMHMYTHSHQTMVTETSITSKFWACFFYNMFIILNSNPIHWYNIFLLASFFR